MATKIALDIAQCAPAPGLEPMARSQATEIAALLKAVADPTRLQILALIRQGENSQACTCDLTGPLNLSQPTISHHMKKLSEVGLLSAERRGTWVYHSINEKLWSQISQLFEQGKTNGKN